MRRLQVLPCPESWDRMRADGDGRFCERCSLHVTDVASLDADGLERLLTSAAQGRACARFELERGQPRIKLGLAAGLLVMALAGCATPGSVSVSPDELELGPQDSGGLISGVVRDLEGDPLANAYVILQSTALEQPQELLTNERGLFVFKALPAGSYTIQTFYGNADVSKILELPKDARVRTNFSVNPEQDTIVGGLLVEQSMIDTTSASSTYSSRMLEHR